MATIEEELATASPVYSLFKDNLLVAYARRHIPEGAEGAIRKSSGKEPIVLAPLTYGIIDCFDTKAARLIIEKSTTASDFDALLFGLKLEGFVVREGEIKPDTSRWRF
jgi:hypothetical protein